MKLELAFGLLLVMGCTVNRALRIFGGEDTKPITMYHSFRDDAIVPADNHPLI